MALIIPKCNAEPETLKYTLQVYYDANDWVSNDDLINKLAGKLIEAGIEDKQKEPQSYTKKTQVLSYYGLIEWEDPLDKQSQRRITDDGKYLYECWQKEDYAGIRKILVKVLGTNTFGRNVLGCESDSDLEAPNIFIKSTLLLGTLSNQEFAYILGLMEYKHMELGDALFDIAIKKELNIKIELNDKNRKWADPKPILALANWGLMSTAKGGQAKYYYLDKDIIREFGLKFLDLRTKNTEEQRLKYDDPEEEEVIQPLPYFYNKLFSAIKTKPFVILGGFSGTGKSLEVKSLAYSFCPKELQESETSPGNYLLVSVKPNWHDATDITGFRSSVNRNYFVTDFMRFLVKAKIYEKRHIPFFVCMDEMNLAPVEEYFSDFLSVIESRKRLADGSIVTDAIVPASVFNCKEYAEDFNIFLSLGLKTTTVEGVKADEFSAFGPDDQEAVFERQDIVNELKDHGLSIPSNVVIIGTVNMDDTTNSFSRKVIDRAMTFETVIGEFTTEYFENKPVLEYPQTPLPPEIIFSDEVMASEMVAANRFVLSPEDKAKTVDFINDVNKDLQDTPFKISYRILNELVLLYRAKAKITKMFSDTESDNNEHLIDWNIVFDDIMMQKVLPRIEGDYEKCGQCLNNLKKRAEDNGWKETLNKISFMNKRFGTDKSGFTSFWN